MLKLETYRQVADVEVASVTLQCYRIVGFWDASPDAPDAADAADAPDAAETESQPAAKTLLTVRMLSG